MPCTLHHILYIGIFMFISSFWASKDVDVPVPSNKLLVSVALLLPQKDLPTCRD